MRVKISLILLFSISGVDNGDDNDGNDDLWKDK